MGCCKSSPNIVIARIQQINSIKANSPLTQNEMVQLETFLSEIPDHCRQSIINLPARQLYIYYQCHKMAIHHGLQALLPKDKDHYIFFNFYSTLSASFLALGELEAAIEGIHITLAILLKHTPMDYNKISSHYYHLANAYKVLHNWKATAQYLIIAIETARLMNDLDQEFICKLQTELQMAKQRFTKDALPNFILFEVKRKRGEDDFDFHRRMTAETITLNGNKHQFNRLLDKQTELQVTDKILKDILTYLEKYITSNRMNERDVTNISSVQFTAIQFKNVQTKTNPLSTALIEAALTMIIDRLNDDKTSNDELYINLQQAPVSLSYRYDNHRYTNGVRVFEMRKKECQPER